MKKYPLAEIVGWYGVVAIIIAYTFLNLGWLDVSDLLYQILNLTGAVSIMIDAYYQKNWQPVVLNLIWAGIAMIALLRSAITF